MINLDSAASRGGLSRKRNLFSHVVEELGSRIVRGDFKPGAALPNEAVLGQEFDASRSVIREAVKSLAAKGLIESRTRTGIRVLSPIHWNLLDPEVLGWRYSAMPPAQFFREIFEIRGLIEPQAAAFAAERASKAEIAEIAAAYAAMEAAEQPGSAAINADLRFHRAILAGAHNRSAPADGQPDRRRPDGELRAVERLASTVFLPLSQGRAGRDRRARSRTSRATPWRGFSPTRATFLDKRLSRPRRKAARRVRSAQARGRAGLNALRRDSAIAGSNGGDDGRGLSELRSHRPGGAGHRRRRAGLAAPARSRLRHAGADVALGLRRKESGAALAERDRGDGPARAAAADGHGEPRRDPQRDRRGARAFRQDRRARQQCRRQPRKPRRWTCRRTTSTTWCGSI